MRIARHTVTVAVGLLSHPILYAVGEDSLLQALNAAITDSTRIRNYILLSKETVQENRSRSLEYAENAFHLSDQGGNALAQAQASTQYGYVIQQDGNYPKALQLYENALDKYTGIADSSGIGENLNNMGICYYFMAQYGKAMPYFQRSGVVKEASGDSLGAGRAYNNTGIMYDIGGKVPEAVSSYLKAARIYEDMERKDLMLGTYQNIGLVHINAKNYSEAEKYYKLSMDLATAINDKVNLATGYNSLGIIKDEGKEFEMAETCYLKALDLNLEVGNKAGLGLTYNNLAVNQQYQGNYSRSKEYYDRSLVIKQEMGNKAGIAITQIGMGQLLEETGDYQGAARTLSNALDNAQAIGYKEYIKQAYEALHSVYAKQHDYIRAYQFQSLFLALKDSIQSEAHDKLITEMQTKYETEKKEKEIALLNKNNELQSAELARSEEEGKRKTLQLMASLIGLGLLGGLALVVIRTSKQRKQANEMLVDRNNEIVLQKEEITRQKEVIEEKNKDIIDSMNYARGIQQAIMPTDHFVREHLAESFILFKPKDIVSGDFYWVAATDDIVFFAAADCTGHGVPGAFVSMVGSNGLNRAVKEYGLIQPNAILDKLGALVVESFGTRSDGMDIALCTLDSKCMKLHFSGANNPLYLIRNRRDELIVDGNSIGSNIETEEGVLFEIKADKQPVGYSTDTRPFTNRMIELLPGDIVYVFSDGSPDQFGGPRGKKFKYRPFKQLLLDMMGKPMEEQKDVLDKTFEDWRGDHEQIDDVCIIGVRL